MFRAPIIPQTRSATQRLHPDMHPPLAHHLRPCLLAARRNTQVRSAGAPLSSAHRHGAPDVEPLHERRVVERCGTAVTRSLVVSTSALGKSLGVWPLPVRESERIVG